MTVFGAVRQFILQFTKRRCSLRTRSLLLLQGSEEGEKGLSGA